MVAKGAVGVVLAGGLVFSAIIAYVFVTGTLARPDKETWQTPVKRETASQDETASWKVLRSEKYGFSFKYPSDWSLRDTTRQENSPTLVLQFAPVPEGTPWGDSFYGRVKVYEHIDDLAAWFHSEMEFNETAKARFIATVNGVYGAGFLKPSDFTQSVKDTTVAGLPAIVEVVTCGHGDCYFMGGPNGYSEKWYLKSGNVVLAVEALTNPRTSSSYILDKIVHSVRF